VSEDKMLSH